MNDTMTFRGSVDGSVMNGTAHEMGKDGILKGRGNLVMPIGSILLGSGECLHRHVTRRMGTGDAIKHILNK